MNDGIVKRGKCDDGDVSITQVSFRRGSADPYDDAEERLDQKGTFFDVKFGAGLRAGFWSLDAALKWAEKNLSGLRWEQ